MEYWEKHYRLNGKSGEGSIGSYRKWKWKIIDKFVNIKDKTVLDVGCGDLSFVKGKKFSLYLGFDSSPTILERNRKKRPDLRFELADVTENIFELGKFDVVLCMDLLFHIMDDDGFKNLLRNLNRWTGEYLFVINWCKNPMPYLKDHYQYFRDLTKYFNLMPDLELIDTDQKRNDPYNMLYVFRKRQNEKNDRLY